MKKAPQKKKRVTRSAPAKAKAITVKQILVPTDFSKNSLKALDYALSFAKVFSAKITLLHAVESHFGGALYGPADFPPLEMDFLESSRKQLTELANQRKSPKVRIQTVAQCGHAVQETVEYAKENKIDLIILATQGHTGFAHIFLGSTAENIVRHAPCPVLVVREHERDIVKI